MSLKLIKGFVITIAGLFIVTTLFSLLIPSQILITRGVVINAKADKVFAEIMDLHNWKHWQPVFKKDSSVFKFETNADGTSNSCEWITKGKANKLIITDVKDHIVTATLQRQGENDIKNTIKVLPLADSNQVQTEWNVLVKLKWYPWEKFYGIFIEKISGQGYEDALNSLKAYAEDN